MWSHGRFTRLRRGRGDVLLLHGSADGRRTALPLRSCDRLGQSAPPGAVAFLSNPGVAASGLRRDDDARVGIGDGRAPDSVGERLLDGVCGYVFDNLVTYPKATPSATPDPALDSLYSDTDPKPKAKPTPKPKPHRKPSHG